MLNDDCMYICAPQTKPLYGYGACIKPIRKEDTHACPDGHENNKQHTSCTALQCMLLLSSHFHTTASTSYKDCTDIDQRKSRRSNELKWIQTNKRN